MNDIAGLLALMQGNKGMDLHRADSTAYSRRKSGMVQVPGLFA